MTPICLDRFPDVPCKPQKAIARCTHCGEDLTQLANIYVGTDCSGIPFTLCESCFDDLSKEQLFTMLGGIKNP